MKAFLIVLALTCLSSTVFAQQLDLSVKTVESHRTELMERLGIHGIAGLVRYASRAGIVHADS
jgi:DNA-binding NarL/FixJ family response regulator